MTQICPVAWAMEIRDMNPNVISDYVIMHDSINPKQNYTVGDMNKATSIIDWIVLIKYW